MTSSMMTKFFQKMSIDIWFTLAKFQVEIQTLSKVIEKKRLGGGGPVGPPLNARRVKSQKSLKNPKKGLELYPLVTTANRLEPV